jgi:regulation of enolase protein 1 (concanavalin A-like superfamily)
MRSRVVWPAVALLIGWAAFPGRAQEVTNLIENGGFESGALTPWAGYANSPGVRTQEVVKDCIGAASPQGPIEGNYCLHVNVTTLGANNYAIGLATRPAITFKSGKKYTFSVFLKCKTGTLQATMKPELGADPWTDLGSAVVTMTDKWAEYHTTTSMIASDVSPGQVTLHLGYALAEFWIDGAKLYEGEYVPTVVKNKFGAQNPTPATAASDIAREVVLSWKSGPFAETHDVYFGTNFDDVNNATVANPLGVLASAGQTGATFDPEGVLEYGKTYYWRVDEVNAPAAPATFKGAVWNFTAEPYSYTLTGVTAAASSFTAGMGPEKTVNGAGLSAGGQHSTLDTDMWLTGKGQPLPGWIQYKFPRVCKLVSMTVWNSNQKVESFVGFGARETLVEYSTDGQTWTPFETVEIPRAFGLDTYTGSEIDLGGIEAKFVKLTIQSNWGGVVPQTGLGEVRFVYVPVAAREPTPADGSDGAALEPTLSWRPGREAVSHKVCLSGDRQAVVNGTAAADTVTDVAYQAGGLEYGKTYYWKVDEVAEGGAVRPGDVWSFSTTEFLAVDDFEAYTDDEGSRIYQAWIDGLTNSNSGSTVGHMTAPFAEQTIVQSGRQSMPMDYDNTKTPFYSEAERVFDPQQDWTTDGITDLSLYVRGYPALGVVDVTETGGKMTLTGAGTDIWGNSDEFTYAYKILSGDGTMTARVTSNGTGTNTWAKGGVMIRDSLNGGSTHASIVITATGGNGASFQCRDTLNGASTSVDSATVVAPPYWVRMERVGGNLNGFVSTDGKNWTSLGSAFIAMEDPVYIGLCVTSHEAGVNRTYQFDSISAGGGVSGAWQGAVISSPQYNSPENLYVTVEDSGGKKATATDAAAVTSGAWTEVRFPLKSFAGVNMAKVAKLTIGVGDKANPKAGGIGRIYVDDVRVGRKGSSDPGAGVAYYALENDVTDGSGSGHDGTAMGDPAYVDGSAGMGKAMLFNGAGGQYVNLGTWDPSASTGQLSVSLWAKWGGLTSSYQGLIGKRDSWAIDQMMWQLEANQTTGAVSFSRTEVYPASGNPVLPVGEWANVLVTFDGTNARFYFNGKMTGEGAFSFGSDAEAAMQFGSCEANGGNPFNGALDEVHIYDRALSAFELNYLFGAK